jgi:tetratricopeptide (TPR) repeat protein
VLSWCEDCADQAERHFETALRLNPRLFEAYYFFARDCFARGRLEKAARLFERAAEVRPEDYQAALLLPQVYDALGRNKDSERATRLGLEIAAERHLQLNPDDVRALYLSSGRWIGAGDRERGLDLARRALELEPDEPTVLFNVACAFAQAELIDEALDFLERGIARGFGHRQWIEQDSDLDSLRDHPRFRALMDSSDTRETRAADSRPGGSTSVAFLERARRSRFGARNGRLPPDRVAGPSSR